MNLKIKNVIKDIFFYICCFIASLITYTNLPIGAVAVFSAAYSMNITLAPVILVTITGILLASYPLTLIYYFFYIALFIAFSLLIKPLVAVEERAEKRKVDMYLFFISIYLSIWAVGFLESFVVGLATLVLYKLFVNSLTRIKNDSNKLIFSSVEEVSASIFITLLPLIFSLYYLKPSFITSGFIQLIITTLTIYLLFKKNLFNSLAYAAITFFILLNINIFNINFVFVLAVLAFFTTVKFSYENHSNIANLLILALNILAVIYFKNNIFIMLSFNISSIIAIIYSYIITKYNKNFTKSNIIMLSDKGETRLKQKDKSQEKNEVNKNSKTKLNNNSDFDIKNDICVFNISKLSRMEEFEKAFYNLPELKEIMFYDEIAYKTNIVHSIFEEITNKDTLDINIINEIFENNNLVLDITNEYISSQLIALEKYSLKALKIADSKILKDQKEKENRVIKENSNKSLKQISDEKNIKTQKTQNSDNTIIIKSKSDIKKNIYSDGDLKVQTENNTVVFDKNLKNAEINSNDRDKDTDKDKNKNKDKDKNVNEYNDKDIEENSQDRQYDNSLFDLTSGDYLSDELEIKI